MFVPRFFPEPENMLLRAGWFRPGETFAVRFEGAASRSERLVMPALRSLSPSCVAFGAEHAGIVFRELDGDMIGYASRCFGREFQCPAGGESYLLRVDENGAEAAAATPAGFLHAAGAIAALSYRNGSCSVPCIRAGVLFDYPAAIMRAVDITGTKCGSAEFLTRFVSLMAGLKYNTLFVDWERLGISGLERSELESLCDRSCISVSQNTGGSAGIVMGLHGPSFLDWEHVSRRPGFQGAAVAYGGELTADAMARSGFLYNLVYSSAMLWKEGYCNFTWESIAEPAMERAREAYRLLVGEPPEPERDLSDVDTAFQCTGCGGKQAIRPGQRATAALMGGKAHALVFTHALEAERPDAGDAGTRPVGRYVVRYADGSESEILLVENETIGEDTAWCSRRYNARTHRFDTDTRLHSLCCRTGIVKTVRADGSLALAYKLAWSNPRPQAVVDCVELEAYTGTGKAICVHGIGIID